MLEKLELTHYYDVKKMLDGLADIACDVCGDEEREFFDTFLVEFERYLEGHAHAIRK